MHVTGPIGLSLWDGFKAVCENPWLTAEATLGYASIVMRNIGLRIDEYLGLEAGIYDGKGRSSARI